MSGHSKWHNIKHKKAATDAKKGQIYTKIGRLIELAARQGADPKLNPSLEGALEKAKENSVPKDVIERAVKKGSGQLQGENLEEVFYEGYGPGGTALYIKCITGNKNRTGSTIRATLVKLGGNLGEPGSVSWQFEEKGIIYVVGTKKMVNNKGNMIEEISPLNISDFEEEILNHDIQDYEIEDNIARLTTSKEFFIKTLKGLDNKGYKIKDSGLEHIASNLIKLSNEDSDKLERLIDMLDDDDDVETVYHNAE